MFKQFKLGYSCFLRHVMTKARLTKRLIMLLLHDRCFFFYILNVVYMFKLKTVIGVDSYSIFVPFYYFFLMLKEGFNLI